MHQKVRSNQNNIYLGVAFLILSAAFLFYKYYSIKGQLDIEVVKSQSLQDSLIVMNNQMNDYTQYLIAINHIVDNDNSAAQNIFESLSNTQDTLLASALQISSVLNRPEIKIIERPQVVQKTTEIVEPLESIEPIVEKTIDRVEISPTQPVEKKEAVDKPIFFKSSKGVKIEYAGQVVNGKANGYGVGLFESGGVYKGSWQNNKRHGKGVYTWKDGEKYDGDFVDDKREGFGIYTWKNGEKYEGQWKNDMRDGKGTIYKANGEIKIAGLFVKDNLQ